MAYTPRWRAPSVDDRPLRYTWDGQLACHIYRLTGSHYEQCGRPADLAWVGPMGKPICARCVHSLAISKGMEVANRV